MQTFNKRGDGGETSLLYGGRVPKSHDRTEAYGTIDEAVSALGLARALSNDDRVRSLILRYQAELFVVGAEMATEVTEYDKLARNFATITADHVDRVERLITELEAEITLPASFIIPGGSPASAALDLARTVIRRSERRAVALRQAGHIQNDFILSYLNRLADFVFLLARFEEQKNPAVVD